MASVSRVTVNNYIKYFRVQIAKVCETRNEALLHKHQFNDWHIAQENSSSKQPGAGIIVLDDVLIAQPISHTNMQILAEHLQKEKENEAGTKESRFNALIDFDQKKVYRIEQHDAKSKHIRNDEVDNFWKLLKQRIVKMRGIQPASLYLHLKEMEFRYNNRQLELFTLLLPLITRADL